MKEKHYGRVLALMVGMLIIGAYGATVVALDKDAMHMWAVVGAVGTIWGAYGLCAKD